MVRQYYHVKHVHIYTHTPFPSQSPCTHPHQITMFSDYCFGCFDDLAAAVTLVNEELLSGYFLVMVAITAHIFMIFWLVFPHLCFDGDLPSAPNRNFLDASCLLRALLVQSWSKNWRTLIQHFYAGWLVEH